jgi:membrane-associated phospholipid phosphatase
MNKNSRSNETKRFIIYSILILAAFTLMFLGFAYALEEHLLHQFDLTIITEIQSFISVKMTSVMEVFTFIGSASGIISIAIVTIIIMLFNKKWWECVFFVIAVIGSTLFNSLLKWVFHRARPTIHPLVTETGYSFPSGHSMSSIVTYGMIMVFLVLFFNKAWSKTLIILVFSLLILLIGISRIYLGVHYPSDVIAGFSAGGTWLIVCLIFLRLIVAKRQR